MLDTASDTSSAVTFPFLLNIYCLWSKKGLHWEFQCLKLPKEIFISALKLQYGN